MVRSDVCIGCRRLHLNPGLAAALGRDDDWLIRCALEDQRSRQVEGRASRQAIDLHAGLDGQRHAFGHGHGSLDVDGTHRFGPRRVFRQGSLTDRVGTRVDDLGGEEGVRLQGLRRADGVLHGGGESVQRARTQLCESQDGAGTRHRVCNGDLDHLLDLIGLAVCGPRLDGGSASTIRGQVDPQDGTTPLVGGACVLMAGRRQDGGRERGVVAG